MVQNLTKRGVRIEFLKEGLVFTGENSPMANLILSVMGAFAEFTWLTWLRHSPLKPNSRHMMEHIERLKIFQLMALPEGLDRRSPNWSTASSITLLPPIGGRHHLLLRWPALPRRRSRRKHRARQPEVRQQTLRQPMSAIAHYQKFAGVFALMISASSWPILRKRCAKVVGK